MTVKEPVSWHDYGSMKFYEHLDYAPHLSFTMHGLAALFFATKCGNLEIVELLHVKQWCRCKHES